MSIRPRSTSGYTTGLRAALAAVLTCAGLSSVVLLAEERLYPELETKEEMLPEDWVAMQEIAKRFAPTDPPPGVPAKYFVRYGGLGNPPKAWNAMSDELIARGRKRNLSMLCQLPVIYHRDASPDGREKAAELFVACARQFIATGDTEAGGTTYMVDRTKVGPNTLSMLSVMQEAGIYDEFVRVWMMERFMASADPGLNMDWARSRLPLSWALVANMADGPLKLHRLRQLQRASNSTLRKLFTPDGGGIHHGCDHLAYASYSVPSIVALTHRLHGSEFGLADDAIDRLRAFGHAHAFMTVDGHVPGNLMARAAVQPARFPQLPGILAALSKMQPSLPALSSADGHLSYNVSAAALHRRDSWLVAIDGARNDMRGVEIYDFPGRGSSFARNSCFGSVQILEAGKPHGYAKPGWDYNHFAGVTSRVVPPENLASSHRPSYVWNGSAVAGGTSLGKDGIWGMVVANGNVPCRKSVFCFDDRITLLTSGIQPDAKGRQIVTTLFQFAFPDTQKRLPEKRNVPLEEAARVADPQGNSYYIHPTPGHHLSIRRRHQTWPLFDQLADNTPAEVRKLLSKKRLTLEERRQLIEHNASPGGNFSLAYVEHLPKAAVADFAFTIFVQQPAVPDALPYEILRQDNHAHILRDKPSRTTAWVLFEAGQLGETSLLQAVNGPCFLMCRETADGNLTLSVATTTPKNPEPIVLQLAGKWKLGEALGPVSPTSTLSGENTSIRIPLANYMPIRFDLVRDTNLDNVP